MAGISASTVRANGGAQRTTTTGQAMDSRTPSRRRNEPMPVLAAIAPNRMLWKMAACGVLPVADKTLARPIVGRFFRFIARHVVRVTRERDETWADVLDGCMTRGADRGPHGAPRPALPTSFVSPAGQREAGLTASEREFISDSAHTPERCVGQPGGRIQPRGVLGRGAYRTRAGCMSARAKSSGVVPSGSSIGSSFSAFEGW